MPRLKVMSGRDVRSLLEANGFFFSRQKGSHMMMVRVLENEDGLIETKTVPVPNHKEVAVGTLGNIVRLSGLARDLFEI